MSTTSSTRCLPFWWSCSGVGLLIWNSNFFQSRAAAVTIDGQDYTAADVQYYYNGALQQEIYNSYSGASTMDYTLDPEDQIYDESTGETWRDHLLDVAIQTLTQQAAIANEAQASGYTMSAQAQESLQNTLDSIQAGTITSGYGSKDAYVRANYGPTMSYDKFVQIMERYYLAADYAQSQVDSYTYDDSQLDAYYEEHADELDTFTLSQFVFQARVNTVDDEGNTIEMTDEEKVAALEEEKAAVKEQAEALQAPPGGREDPEALAWRSSVTPFTPPRWRWNRWAPPSIRNTASGLMTAPAGPATSPWWSMPAAAARAITTA